MCLIDPRKILVQERLSRVLDCPVFDLPVGQVSDIGGKGFVGLTSAKREISKAVSQAKAE